MICRTVFLDSFLYCFHMFHQAVFPAFHTPVRDGLDLLFLNSRGPVAQRQGACWISRLDYPYQMDFGLRDAVGAKNSVESFGGL